MNEDRSLASCLGCLVVLVLIGMGTLAVAAFKFAQWVWS